MWSCVGKQANQRWLWHASAPHTGQVLASVFGRRQDDVCRRLQTFLKPFGIPRFSTDGWGAYERHLAPEHHTVGKQPTHRSESKHITLRTRLKRLVRRTICFSQTAHMHALGIGLCVNRYACGCAV
jgi:insertion element IS1 protein InsB